MSHIRLIHYLRALAVVAIGLTLLFLTASCIPSTPAPQPCKLTTPGLGGIAGSVFQMNGTRAVGASISLDFTPVATADTLGSFCLVNLSPRQYAISAKSQNQASIPKNVVVPVDDFKILNIQFNTTAMPYDPDEGQGVACKASTPQPPAALAERR